MNDVYDDNADSDLRSRYDWKKFKFRFLFQKKKGRFWVSFDSYLPQLWHSFISRPHHSVLTVTDSQSHTTLVMWVVHRLTRERLGLDFMFWGLFWLVQVLVWGGVAPSSTVWGGWWGWLESNHHPPNHPPQTQNPSLWGILCSALVTIVALFVGQTVIVTVSEWVTPRSNTHMFTTQVK